MRKPSYKLKGFKIKRGFWKYKVDELEQIDILKGENSFKGSEEIYGELESVKIGKIIYDIEKVEEGIVYLTEPVVEDFSGIGIYEWSIPLIIRKTPELYYMSINEESNLKKGERKVTPLSRCDKATRQLWLKTISEDKVDVEVDANNVMLIIVDELSEKQAIAKNNLIKSLLELVFYIDMDYITDSGKDLWSEWGIKKGNYVAVTELLSSTEMGILSDDVQISKLKITIEAIKSDEKDIDTFVTKKMAEANVIKTLAEIRKNFDNEEDYQKFVKMTLDNMIEEGTKDEGVKL